MIYLMRAARALRYAIRIRYYDFDAYAVLPRYAPPMMPPLIFRLLRHKIDARWRRCRCRYHYATPAPYVYVTTYRCAALAAFRPLMSTPSPALMPCHYDAATCREANNRKH